MSRYEVQALKPDKHEVVVGWDRPMNTYFGQVKDKALLETDEEIILWVGGGFNEIQTVDDLRDKLAEYVSIDSSTEMCLLNDKELS